MQVHHWMDIHIQWRSHFMGIKEAGTCYSILHEGQMSRIDFGEVFMVQMYLKEVQKHKEDLRITSNRSNPTVKAKVCLQNVFEQDLEQNRRRIKEE